MTKKLPKARNLFSIVFDFTYKLYYNVNKMEVMKYINIKAKLGKSNDAKPWG